MLIKICSIILIIFGVLGILSAIILGFAGENLTNYIGTIILSVLIIISGVLNLKIK